MTAESSGAEGPEGGLCQSHDPSAVTMTCHAGVAGPTNLTKSCFYFCVFVSDGSCDLILLCFQVRFSPVVHVHVMRSWTFARQVSRKGNWEVMARDRERFRRRIQEAESLIGPCLSPAHRRKVQVYLDSALTE